MNSRRRSSSGVGGSLKDDKPRAPCGQNLEVAAAGKLEELN